MTDYEREVFRNIMYAVETGGEVYGQKDYADFTEAGTNTSTEIAITIGAGQWYAGEAKRLLNLIRQTACSLTGWIRRESRRIWIRQAGLPMISARHPPRQSVS